MKNQLLCSQVPSTLKIEPNDLLYYSCVDSTNVLSDEVFALLSSMPRPTYNVTGSLYALRPDSELFPLYWTLNSIFSFWMTQHICFINIFWDFFHKEFVTLWTNNNFYLMSNSLFFSNVLITFTLSPLI